ncbi:PAS domain S-box protein [Ramlibacter tataouinensis]|uniref:Candidate histidine kinase, hybrid n=1 Tax=Ramlibacter tataouinensis (strain ATCC BAA-407 / DSM 14655 / LMG 21543 / TTB310) TaxID=365046 RepID=F5Y608_RAMTT|nr:PAS domain S-box protein [Ramlibacter tataouinensis]AEG91512.1 candidate histidine kinase, hybrid [Ramlibacter tataouinensis TTB310]
MSAQPEAEQHQEPPTDGLDDAVPSQGYRLIPLVGLGGSAGAIPVLQQFFRAVPAEAGLAFVVVIHLNAEHESTLAELLQRTTRMRVTQLTERQRVEPNTVYVIPPGKSIKVGDGFLRLDSLQPERRHVAVDLFFRSLADAHGPHSAAVVLSGADGDGAIGIKRIKERGGLTIAQDPQECEHGGMPRSAIATGMVDWVLPVADMAPRLLAYFRLEKALRLPAEEAPPAAAAPPGGPGPAGDGEEAPLRDVLAFLRTRTGRDFSAYKRATIVRRIARRMQVNGTDNLHGYLNCLRTRPGEAGALLQDLLISVTNFFRDADCFGALEAHLGELFRDRAPGDTLRVWVPACATGEEAYSLAILLCERARQLDAPPVIQIFATDLDEEAIRVGREAVYPATIEADVPQEHLRRYFLKEHQGYRVRREVRELVLFAQHDVLRDSPFSRLDLVSCRNLLIYLNREAQQRVFQTFHFALQPHGRLFLGASESIEEAGGLFSVIDKKNRIFGLRPAPRLSPPTPHGPSSLALALDLPPALAEAPAIPGRGLQPVVAPVRAHRAGEAGRGTSWGEVHFKLLEVLAPPSVLVDAEHEILHLSPQAGRFLQYGGGEPSRNLMRAVHPSLRIELRAALFQAAQTQQTAEVVATPVELAGQPMEVQLRVSPTLELAPDLFMVMFSARPVDAARAPALAGPERAGADPVAHHLDRELERLKSHLRDTVEQYEASTEELKASNEELQAMNEELRSATEELETSREELQSINEELSTVNYELKAKVEELAHANSDIHNLMDATEIATVFLDRELRVMRYTPSAVRIFNLIPTDLGRPLADLATRLEYRELGDDARRVLERLIPVEREVGLADGNWFLTRLLPYRTLDDRIAGVVLSFIDITERKKAEEVRLWLSAVVNSTSDGIVSFAPDLTVLSWNSGCERIFGWSAQEMIGQSLALTAPSQEERLRANVRLLEEGRDLHFETLRWRKDGTEIQVALSISPIRDPDGRVIGGTAIVRDVTETRRAQEQLRASEERLRLIVENARDFAIFSLDPERRVTAWNSGAQRLLGYSEEEVLGRSGDVIFTEGDRAAGAAEAEARKALAEGRAEDERPHRRKDGSTFWASGVAMRMDDAAGTAVGFVKILRDQTEQREAREALVRSQGELVRALEDNLRARRELEAADAAKDRFLAVLSHELRNPLASISSASEMLAAPDTSGDDLRRAADVVRRQADAMRELLDDLLDVSRLRLGRLTLKRQPVLLADVVAAALESTRPLVRAAGHRLTVRLPQEPLWLQADPLRLGQLLSNLIGNAAKYTPHGGKIELSAEADPEQVVVTVADNGIGIDPSEIERMFDLFTQAHDERGRPNDGLGIGLALSRSIAELHGGWLRAASAGRGQGSRFQLGLPLHRPGAAEGAAAAAAPASSPPAAEPGGGELVLIADDNVDAAWALAKLMELSGFQVVAVHSGEEALRLAQARRPAIMLVDIGMPDLSGHEVARRVRAGAGGQDVMLVAVTGWGQEGDQRDSLAAGFDAHLTKPLNMGRLKSLLAELRRRRAR